VPRRLLRVLPPRPRAFVDRNLHTIGYVLLFAAFFASLAVAYDASRRASRAETDAVRTAGRQAFRQIEQSRIEQTRAGCVRTNRKILTVLREQVRQQMADVRRIPPAELERLGFGRAELLARYRERLRRVAAVDCDALAKRVARTSPNFSP
jgi:hypothetical protein